MVHNALVGWKEGRRGGMAMCVPARCAWIPARCRDALRRSQDGGCRRHPRHRHCPAFATAPIRGAWPRALHDASQGLGFIYVAGHGIPSDVTDTLRATAYRFFRGPEEARRAVRVSSKHRGLDRPRRCEDAGRCEGRPQGELPLGNTRTSQGGRRRITPFAGRTAGPYPRPGCGHRGCGSTTAPTRSPVTSCAALRSGSGSTRTSSFARARIRPRTGDGDRCASDLRGAGAARPRADHLWRLPCMAVSARRSRTARRRGREREPHRRASDAKSGQARVRWGIVAGAVLGRAPMRIFPALMTLRPAPSHRHSIVRLARPADGWIGWPSR